jgi:hypothetical protein
MIRPSTTMIAVDRDLGSPLSDTRVRKAQWAQPVEGIHRGRGHVDLLVGGHRRVV